MILNTFLIISLILFTKNIINILKYHCDNNIFFYILSVILLLSGYMLFWIYYQNITFSLITSFLLMIITFLFLLELKNNYHQKTIYMLPFFIITIYLFSNTINLFLILAHQ